MNPQVILSIKNRFLISYFSIHIMNANQIEESIQKKLKERKWGSGD